MMNKSTNGVLCWLRGSPRCTEYASPLRFMRPCWANLLSILRGVRLLFHTCGTSKFPRVEFVFPQPASHRLVWFYEEVTAKNCATPALPALFSGTTTPDMKADFQASRFSMSIQSLIRRVATFLSVQG